MDIPVDCLNCGVCCFSKSATYIRVSGDDWSRLGEGAEDLARFVGQRAYMRMEDGHCLALQITTRRGQPPVFFCAIYERRPQICRDLGRGSPEAKGNLRRRPTASPTSTGDERRSPARLRAKSVNPRRETERKLAGPAPPLEWGESARLGMGSSAAVAEPKPVNASK